MSKVIRLNDSIIRELEEVRSELVKEYECLYEGSDPALQEYEVNRWKEADYMDLIDRSVMLALYYLKH